MSTLAGFDDAPVYERLPRFSPGTYIVEVIELTEFKSADSDDAGDMYFKGTFKIVEAAPGSTLAVGDLVAELEQLFGKWKKSAYGRVKAIIGACTQEKASQIKSTDYEEVVSPENPCAGSKVKVFAASKAKNPQYCTLSWMPYTPAA